jgi:transposase
MRIIGLDIHRAFAEAVAWNNGKLSRLGRVTMRREQLEEFAKQLSNSDIVVIEATGNAASVAAVIGPHVSRVVIANPKQVRLIAHAKIKTDKIDAGVLAQLYASGFLPEVWIADETTQALRRQVTRRNQIVRQRSRLKNIIQSILHAHLIPSCPHQDLCGPKGRAWLSEQILPGDERLAVERHLREFDRLTDDLKVIERDLAQSALSDERARRLMTIPGIDMVVALALIAAIGDIERFAKPKQLVGYLGLNPSVRQSGPGPAYHGRITKQGRGHARGMLVEAGWAAARSPGPLRSFFLRVQSRRGQHVAAVATARKLAILIWHLLTKGENYLWARPALHARKLRDLELKAGYKPARGQKGTAHAYNLKSHRDQERGWVEQAEAAYARPVCGRVEHRRAKGAHGRRKGGATIRRRGRALTSGPALCHAVVRARQQISKKRGPSGTKRGAVLVMVKTMPPPAVASRPVLTISARDAVKQARPGRRNGSPLPNKETACRSHQSFAGSWS